MKDPEYETKDSDTEEEPGTEKQPELADEVGYPTGLALTFIIAALVLSIFLVSLDMTMVPTAIPSITDEFRGLEDVAWYGSAFFMTLGGFQSTWGKVFKYFPLKAGFLISILIFEIGNLVCGVAPNSTALIVGRAIAGVGAAGMGSGAYTIMAFTVPPKKRPIFTNILGTAYGVAAVVGPLIGGVVADRLTWRWCFYINPPIGCISGLIILCAFAAPKRAKPVDAPLKEKMLQMDPVGIVLVMGGMISYTLALQYGGQTMAWNDRTVLGLSVGFVVIVIVFGFWEFYNGERSMIVPRLFANRDVRVSAIFTFLFAGSYFIVLYYLPMYFQSVHPSRATESGMHNLPLILSVAVSTMGASGLISATGLAAPVAVVSAVLATVASGLLYTLDIRTSPAKVLGYQILGGHGWGAAFQVPIVMAQATAAPGDISSVTAIILLFQNLGGAFMLSAAHPAFVRTMMQRLAMTAPSVDPLLMLGTGATQIRTVVPPDVVPGVLVAYMAGIQTTFVIALVSVGLAVTVGIFSRFKRLNSRTLKVVDEVV
ncbi:major facilitator superfamily domain-containing protein [Chaetomium fimeti]|uniref:Major facilitator superfamily domain-containing protein n=1 Tax=Chaetomium fimeti TaxID=1854472 RepID=A0AAE0HJF7_9PEZI|nr:major facilitator superfamily domain-containing protein [Chaetomium fimeti]